MPNIRQYQAPALGLQPDETGIRAAVNAGRSIARSYDEAASATTVVGNELARNVASTVKDVGDQVVKFAEHREISQGAATFAELNDRLTQDWNDRAKSADPNDPTVAAKFREETLEPALEKYRDSFLTEGGQNFAERHAESLRNHMYEKSAADMATLAANAVAVNVRQTGNSLSNTAVNDPSAVPHLLSSVDTMIGGMIDSAPNLKGAVAAKARLELSQKMRESIVKSGAIGAIEKSADPEATAQAWGAKYPEYINGDELRMLSANARQQIRAARMDAAYSDHLNKQVTEVKSDATETGILQKLYSGDPQQQGQVSAKAVVNDPNLTRVAKERMINVVNREMKPETDAKTSAQSSVDIFRAMRDPNADPAKITQMIYEARAKDPGTPGSITKTDMADLQKQLIDLKTPQGVALAADRNDFLKRYAPTIDPSMGDASSLQFGHHTALGQQKMYEVEKTLGRQEQALRKAGQDPHSLYDPSSPNFFGKPENLIKYRATMQDAAAYQAGLGGNLTGKDRTVTGVDVQPAKPPEVGAIVQGFKFKGGDPSKPANWEKVQ